jgi:dCTP deaminase
MLLNDIAISRLAQAGMITPYVGTLIREVEASRSWAADSRTITSSAARPVISYGPSSYGYDIRLSPKEFRIFRHVPGTVVNPKAFSPANLETVELHRDEFGDYFILPAHSYGLGVALEHLALPPDVTAQFIGKSTYARCGVIANLTPGEAGWRGHLTLEFSNSSGADCRLYANEGIVQALFYRGEPCSTSYEDRAGKYQDQPESVVVARA